ncbi:MAG: endonuclease, partial [Bacteroidales bacterium]
MKKLLLLLCLLRSATMMAQIDSTQMRIVFYNVENLFDPENDSLTNDDDFTPEGMNSWSYGKYQKKICNISKVLLSIGQGEPPGIIGLAEIENEKVLKSFCYYSPLKNYGYRYVHYDSPDARGIEVA